MIIKLSDQELRVLKILKDWYPITFEELRDELSMRKETLQRILNSLVVKGIVQLEPLEDKTYIRLLVPEIDVTKKRGKRPKTGHDPEDFYDALMYQ
jgi:DNA-binding MarR family transcriptional regulator